MRSRLSHWLLAAALLAAAAAPSHAAPGWLGVSTQTTDADLRSGLDLTRDGLLVNRVFDGSPAAKAGLEKGDVILRFNGKSVTDPDQLRDAVRGSGSGKSAKVEIWRKGAARTLDVRLAEVPTSEQESLETPVPPPTPVMGDRSSAPELRRNAPPAPPAPKAVPSPREHRRVWVNGRELTDEEIERKLKDIRIEGLDDLGELKELKAWSEGKGPFTLTASGRGRLGVRVEKLTPEMGEALGVSGGKGVVVLQVYEDTPAQKAGLRAGDVILEVAGHTVTDREELSKELGRQEGRVDILLTRKGTQRTVQAELPARSRTYGWTMDPDTKSFSFGNPELHRTPWVYRYQTEQEERAKADAELREEMTQLKQELQELKQQLGEQQKAKVPPKPKASTTPKSPATPKK